MGGKLGGIETGKSWMGWDADLSVEKMGFKIYASQEVLLSHAFEDASMMVLEANQQSSRAWSRLFHSVGLSKSVVFINISRLPRIADPHVWYRDSSEIAILFDHVFRKMAFLLLVFVMQHEDGELSLFRSTLLFPCCFHIFLQLTDGVFEGRSGVIHFVDDEDVLADQVGHFEGGEIQPLGAGDFGAGLLDLSVTGELLVEGETDGLDGDVGRAGLLEERSVVRLQLWSRADLAEWTDLRILAGT
jgi:hypothetical protein